jgi:hypothetical protein
MDYLRGKKMNAITQEQAKAIALQHLAKTRSIEITDVWGNWNVYGAGNLESCWYILSSFSDSPMLASSRLIAISKETGKILFDGSANDEG